MVSPLHRAKRVGTLTASNVQKCPETAALFFCPNVPFLFRGQAFWTHCDRNGLATGPRLSRAAAAATTWARHPCLLRHLASNALRLWRAAVRFFQLVESSCRD